jgi:hypothetical protein
MSKFPINIIIMPHSSGACLLKSINQFDMRPLQSIKQSGVRPLQSIKQFCACPLQSIKQFGASPLQSNKQFWAHSLQSIKQFAVRPTHPTSPWSRAMSYQQTICPELRVNRRTALPGPVRTRAIQYHLFLACPA